MKRKIIGACLIVALVAVLLHVDIKNPYALVFVSLALGIAGKLFFQEIIAGWVVSFDFPCKVGETIEMPSKKFIGDYRRSALFTSRFDSIDTTDWRIPNSDLVDRPIMNNSRRDGRRVTFTVYLDLKGKSHLIPSLSQEVRAQILEHPDFNHKTPLVAHLNGFSLGSGRFMVFACGTPSDWALFQDEIQTITLKTIEKHKIPFFLTNDENSFN